ncbi:MAG: hypothetical protein IT449_07980 [Phycisphaerales bacterium]|nr:hypothetical protein [Phycisphaerales bacterium]
MPTYDYECTRCGEKFELFQSIKDKAKKTLAVDCKDCKGKAPVVRCIGTGGGLIFKGSGFYITDYRSDGYKQAAKADGDGGKPSGDGKSDSGGGKGDRAGTSGAAGKSDGAGKSDAGAKSDGGSKSPGPAKSEGATKSAGGKSGAASEGSHAPRKSARKSGRP